VQAIGKALQSMTNFSSKIIRSYDCECGTKVEVIKVVYPDLILEGKTIPGRTVIADKCSVCENRMIEEEARIFAVKAKKKRIENIFEKYSLISEDLRKATFDSYIPDHLTQEEAKAKALWYSENFKNEKFKQMDWSSILFQGTYGLGKSHLSYCVAEKVKANGYTTIFINLPDLLNAFKDTYKNKSDVTELEILQVIKDVDLLILDEIGAEYIKENDGKESWAVDKIYTIINSRLGKPTLFTTNYSSAALREKYGVHGGRIVSRMMQGTKVIKIEGEDYRTKGA
jgi:DNA replication protein DnaC